MDVRYVKLLQLSNLIEGCFVFGICLLYELTRVFFCLFIGVFINKYDLFTRFMGEFTKLTFCKGLLFVIIKLGFIELNVGDGVLN